MIDTIIFTACREYARARCNARLSFSRTADTEGDRTPATKQFHENGIMWSRTARSIYAGSNREIRPYLDAIFQVLSTNRELNDPIVVLRVAGLWEDQT